MTQEMADWLGQASAADEIDALRWAIDEAERLGWISPIPAGHAHAALDLGARLSAAGTLVPDGARWTLSANGRGLSYASINDSEVPSGATPELALARAAVLAREGYKGNG